MATFYGADVEQLDRLAVALESEGRALDALLRRLDARLQSVYWLGPDAERSRSDWSSSVFPRCLIAVEGLTSTAQVVRSNAAAQRDVSGSFGSSGIDFGEYRKIPSWIRPEFPWPSPLPTLPGFPGFQRPFPFDPEGLAPLRPLPLGSVGVWLTDPPVYRTMEGRDTNFFQPSRDALGTRIPGTLWSWGDVGGLVPGASNVLAVRDMADQLSQGQIPVHGMVDTAAGALRKAPHTYLPGVALGTWNTTAEEFGKADFSAQTLATTHDYIGSDPWGAATAASEAVVSFLPNLVKNFL